MSCRVTILDTRPSRYTIHLTLCSANSIERNLDPNPMQWFNQRAILNKRNVQGDVFQKFVVFDCNRDENSSRVINKVSGMVNFIKESQSFRKIKQKGWDRHNSWRLQRLHLQKYLHLFRHLYIQRSISRECSMK